MLILGKEIVTREGLVTDITLKVSAGKKAVYVKGIKIITVFAEEKPDGTYLVVEDFATKISDTLLTKLTEFELRKAISEFVSDNKEIFGVNGWYLEQP